jgi:hypothetical protein
MPKTTSMRWAAIVALLIFGIHSAHATPTPAPVAGKKVDISKALGLTEIKVQMAESRLKLNPSPQAINDLIVALEDFLNTTCLAKLPQTLSYSGNPSDPVCIARMQQVLEINPGNPVGLCVRDGITAQSCVDAYQNQQISIFYPSSSLEGLDPALKVGLSAADLTKIAGFEQSLANIDAQYRAAIDDVTKRKLLDDAALVYEQALSVACRISSLKFQPKESSAPSKDHLELEQTKERLLQVPPAIRGDYQRQAAEKVQQELQSGNVSAERRETLQLMLRIIDSPEEPLPQKAQETIRTRVVLAKCYDFMEQAKKAAQDLPSSTCYREGWYSPQCIQALKRWRAVQKQAEAKATPKAPNQPNSFRF